MGRKHCGKRRNCFQKACFPGASKGVIVWEWVKLFLDFAPEMKKKKKHCGNIQ